MSYALTEQFLAKCLAAKTGMDQEAAAEVTAALLSIQRAMSLITAQRLEAAERDAHALDLAGKGVPRVTIALRIGVSRVAVYDAIKRHQQARRAALRVAG